MGSRHLLSFLAIVAVAGCGGASLQNAAVPGAGAMVRPGQADAGPSWMLPNKKRTTLIYSTDWLNGDVNVYEYPKGELVGQITGFTYPYGGCVDLSGDEYVTDIGTGSAVEYAHGGTSPLNTYSPGGEPIGCSVDKHGDVAITSLNPGEVTIYAGGNPSDGTVYNDSACTTMWPMGYDDKGNLIGVGEHNGVAFCALLAGKTSETTLTASAFKIITPGGTMWDGKYIAIADQTVNSSHETGVVEASLKGTTLTSHGEITLGSSCGGNDNVSPFILGTKNTPVNRRQGKVVVGAGPLCSGSTNGVSYWKYPAGGNPYTGFSTTDTQHNIAAVSIGK
ncbi:MAG TPA: hypothetical protein VKR56_01490 [Candidatus Cybelea sp.]|nr:hypothetical protein [Candidatus Cybelea sp.]